MADKFYPKSNLPIRRTVELLPSVFQTSSNDKFLSGVLDPLVQPGVLDKVVGYVGRRYEKTYTGTDVYVDTDNTLRSRYQLEPGVVYKNLNKIENFYDYLDFKNQLKFFGNIDERDDKITEQEHYTWNPPVDWDKFINYREYYWQPSGPPSLPIYGQTAKVTSTYKVVLGTTGNSFVFTPDSYTNNPTITLYRGQTYKFKVNAPGEGFSIRTNYDTGSLIFQPYHSYKAGSLAVYDGNLWKAKRDISPSDGSSISIDSQDWEFVDLASSTTALEYSNGVTNNGTQNGTLTFEVPYDAPDTLYYQGLITPDRFGKFLIADIESNSFININKDIIGKSQYTSSNGIELSSGMIVEFRGNVTPAEYSHNNWLVEGVGDAITLTRFDSLVVPVLTTDVPEVLFDNEGFDTQPFDDATAYPTYKDYTTIRRDSRDLNPWSRYNRWFHRSVLEKSYSLRGEDFPATESLRAKRPIIEFKPNLQLYNFGSVAKQTVDYLDTNTTDIFSIIEGSSGYNIDGEFLFEGARVLFVADTDSLANNKIYEVQFITHNNLRQIHLKEALDSESAVGSCLLIRRGNKNSGKMFHFTGTAWKESQQKITVNQSPMFDGFDNNGISFSNEDTYPTNTFVGTEILSYKVGSSVVDKELGFSISYLNINNIGDIQFNWSWDSAKFEYVIDRVTYSKDLATGFYKFNNINGDDYQNGWLLADTKYFQPIIDSQIVKESTNILTFNTVRWENLKEDNEINFYVNGTKYLGDWTRTLGTFTFSTTFEINDAVSLKLISDIEPDQGYYEIPVGLEKNPFNDNLITFTLGQAIDHLTTALEFNIDITGIVPGNSNLRDISNFQKFGKRFLKHSGLTPVVLMSLCDKTHNIVKSIQYSKQSYTEFKNNFLSRALEIDYNDNIPDFVDEIINSLTKTKNSTNQFSESDMIGSGAFTSIVYEVDDPGIKTFSLSTKFDLSTPSSRAVYVYFNGNQLLNSQDYTFNSTFGFVQLSVNLTEGDVIEIREYVSTSSNYIPATPTSMGLYKKYTPMKFVDDTYVEPREVIQGHDGSISATYGDFRDDLLLELEYRIYNNIKQEYNEDIFNIDDIVGGYYGVGLYKKSQLDIIVSQEFLKWIQNTNINYTLNSYFDSQNSFTYTYTNMTDPTRSENLPGYWRGVYQYFYDTDRPHRCPWEMLGFSEKPTWWESEYGPAPYTRGNLILWEDLANGIIRQGTRKGRYARYTRDTLLSHIPVDDEGRLLSPLDSGLARDFSLINNQGSFVLGDIAPVEYAWRSSSEWPFAVVIAMALMRPFEFISNNFNKDGVSLNNLGQTIYSSTGKFITKENYGQSTDNIVGLGKYIIDYVKSKGIDETTLWDKINNIDVQISHRMSGFVDQQQQKFLLDSKSPAASSSSVYVPPENYDIIFNVSSPIASLSYSGVIIEKNSSGWVLKGYDDIQPYFNYFQALPNQRDPIISVGGTSENFLDWQANKLYSNGILVRYANEFYRALKSHTSGDVFDIDLWKKVAGIPKTGAVEASGRRTFNTLVVKRLSYGTQFTTIQQVVDFLLGYEAYLKSVGFIFDNYDPENKVSQDWLSAAKEFMFWTKHSWQVGSLISLSPAAQKVNITVPVGVADSVLEGFYNYQVLKGDGKPLQPKYIDVSRNFQNITVTTTNTTDGIYYLKLFYVLKEHVTIFDDKTVFNDTIYDKTTGYRQGRIKVHGYRTTDWDGDYTSPGFLFDNVNIQPWVPYTDYKLGDIVSYKSYNWTSLINQPGSQTFNDAYWSKLDTTPEKQLVPNFDYKIKGFSDYFEVTSDGLDKSHRDLARHTIGYQTRNYLQNLSEDPVTQFQIYQGFVREKGTANSITKIFGKLSRSETDSISLNEEWAFLVGKVGGVDQLTEVEIQIEKNKLEVNPQQFLIETTKSALTTDQKYRITSSDFTIVPTPFNVNISPTADLSCPYTAGYITSTTIDHSIKTREDLLTLDINSIKENDHIWVTFEKDSWTVLRVNESATLEITDVTRPSDTTVVITFNRPHSIQIDEYVGFRNILNLVGFYKVSNKTTATITVNVSSTIQDPVIDYSTITRVQLITECRFADYQSIDNQQAALLKNKSRLFVDSNDTGNWEVVEKNKQYSPKTISDYGVTNPLFAGSSVLYDNINKQIISSIPGSGIVVVYVETDTGLQIKQILSPPVNTYSNAVGSFGKSMALSPDGRFLIIGTPEASGLKTNYQGPWESQVRYQTNDIVLYSGQIWRAKNPNYLGTDGSTVAAVNTDDWEIATNIPVLTSGRVSGFYNQGMIAIYEFSNGRYTNAKAFVSPRPVENEKFGSNVTVSYDGTNYYMAVSAVGSVNSSGRVYLFKNTGTDWEHLENSHYKGIYNPSTIYREGDIVWQPAQDPIVEEVKGNLWQALETQQGDGSTLTLESSGWIKVSDVSTSCSLPTNVSIEDDGSTVAAGIISVDQLTEIIKQDEQFGYSLTMSRDGSILVVGAPYADGQYFSNYKGLWRADVEYAEGEVVKYSDIYYRLGDASGNPDSTYRSQGEDPSSSANWQEVGDSAANPSGKVFVYKKTSYDLYQLIQTLTSANISSYSDVSMEINVGDQFGYSVDVDSSGTTLIISSPRSDINYQNQGSVYVLNFDSNISEFKVKQKLESYEMYPSEYFGYGVSISPDGYKIAIGSKNTYSHYPIIFDSMSGTLFDQGRTSFYVDQGYTGGVYIFDKKDNEFFLTEKLESVLVENESFGYSIDCVGSKVLVGSPYYRKDNTGDYIGNIRLFSKDSSVDSWTIISQQSPLVDIRKINSVELYDNIKNVKIQDIDFIDPAKGKILNLAEEEIKFKTPYDPAVYTVGTEDVVVDSSINWLEKNVGQLWWNVGNAKWMYSEIGDISYRQGNWTQLVTGASIDVYEWVETPLLPSEWAALADTNEGLAVGISGQPLYPNDDTYSTKQFYNSISGQVNKTLYYYWVKNKSTVPSNLNFRRKSCSEVASLISNPVGTGLPFIAFVDSDKFITYNFDSIIQSDTALLNIKYKNELGISIPVHKEYQLMTEGIASSLPTPKLENKWIDSLVGFDIIGNRVPDINIPAKQKYGIDFRPRQSMFVNKDAALKLVVNKINSVLLKQPFATIIDFTNLNLKDSAPAEILNLYDVQVDTEIDLQNVGTIRTKKAVLSANIVNGELDTIDIIDPGFGYKVVPNVVINGDGKGASAEVTLDNQGRIRTVTVLTRGKKYSTINASVRYFSVLVNSDSTINNFWSIYSWDDVRKTFFRTQSQAYDTTRYWSYIDWWKSGYNNKSRITKELLSIHDEVIYKISVGDLIRVKEYGSGGWAVFEKVSDTGSTFLDRFELISRENGTIKLSDSLYDASIFGIGFDRSQAYDDTNYDINTSLELRNILKAVKEDIFVGDFNIEWNNLFFASMRYVLSEQQYVDWMFKTSFVNATHNVGAFSQPTNYKNDNLSSYQEYINEVKPFRTTVREYVSQYTTPEKYDLSVADFDLEPTFSVKDGKVIPIKLDNDLLNVYPWKWWSDNNGYSITDIQVYDSGELYKTPPKVLIEGSGTGATAQAYISNGKVSGIVVLNAGQGYLSAPTVSLVGGNSAGARSAKAVAIIGNSLIRSLHVSVKFDRLTTSGLYTSFSQSERFVATGTTSVFNLSYAPSRDKNKISVYKNNQLLLNSDYTITLYYSTVPGFKSLQGKLNFAIAPSAGDIIVVNYDKNIELFDAVNRIEQKYNPKAGMIGKDLGQLMTGIDFGGVQIQGTTFDVTGGWDALPWFTDNWDSVEANSDYYHVCDGSTTYVTLPYVPANGQIINIYIKNSVTGEIIRIDDPNYTDAWDSSVAINPNAQMPSFVGDGNTSNIEIGTYISTSAGDILIFRPIESDGSVTITDDNLLDTKVSGGTLSAIDGAYVTANGATVEEIIINGGSFISPEQVPAPEENVPGQVLDSVSIKVYNNIINGSAPLHTKLIRSTGVDTSFNIGQPVLQNSSVIVYIDKIKQVINIDYTLDLINQKVNFASSPPADSLVEILSIGLGGLGIIDYQEFIADGNTNLFLTNADYDNTSNVYVTLNGRLFDTGFKNSTGIIDTNGKTLVEFGFNPEAGDTIKIVCLSATTDIAPSDLSVININTQTVYFEGSTRTFDIDGFFEYSRGSSGNAVIVEVDGRILKGSDTIYRTYDGTNNVIVLGQDPYETPGSILPSNLKVFINDVLVEFITNYVFDGPTKELTIYPDSLNIGDIIKVENDLRREYTISGNSVTILDDVSMVSADETDNVKIDITWFNEYPTLDIVSDEKTGGRVNIQLSRIPISSSYVWVYKNGNRLMLDKDYYVSLPRGAIYLKEDTTSEDKIKTISFSKSIFKLPSAYEIHKDMLNVYHFNRFSLDDIKLASDLNYFDTTITLNDASSLADPVRNRNIPGVVWISGERIEYMTKTENVLGQLRRGTRGTPIGEKYLIDTKVADVGYNDIIPYEDTQERYDFYSDGSSLLIGPLEFIPTKSNKNRWYNSNFYITKGIYDEKIKYVTGNVIQVDDSFYTNIRPCINIKPLESNDWETYWDLITIPTNYGPCDTIEVFAEGRRLVKDPQVVWSENNGIDGFIVTEADFSVDGSSNYLRLTNPLKAGTRITLIRRTGKTWYDRSETSASSGVTLLNNNTPVAKFIAQKTTSIPE